MLCAAMGLKHIMKLEKVIRNSTLSNTVTLKRFCSRPVRIYAFFVARIREFIEFREQTSNEHHSASLNDEQSHVRCSAAQM